MEGRLHRLLKKSVRDELKHEGYALYSEPVTSPNKRLWWKSYRPDLLGVVSDESYFKLALVECETKPNQKRVLDKTSKIRSTLVVQMQLYEQCVILPILAIPPCTFSRINIPKIRWFWEIWIINRRGEIVFKISRSGHEFKSYSR